MSDRGRVRDRPEGMHTGRLFVAVLLPESWLALLGEAQQELRQVGLGLRYVRLEGIHLTLKFLGETASDRIAVIERELAEAAVGARPFTLRLGALGTFGPPRRPRVVWAGVDGDRERLHDLHEAVDLALHRAGFDRERRAFNPHLTLARVPDQMPAAEATRIGSALAKRAWHTAAPYTVNSLALMRSELGAGGARYTALGAWPLGGDSGPV